MVCAYGGGNKYEQSKAFEKGAEIAIATPGRLIDMIKMKVTSLERVTYLVLDEADRMFDMGFEPQVRSICDHVRPDRQCQLYSATFKKRIGKYIKLGPILTSLHPISESILYYQCVPKVIHINWGLSYNCISKSIYINY